MPIHSSARGLCRGLLLYGCGTRCRSSSLTGRPCCAQPHGLTLVTAAYAPAASPGCCVRRDLLVLIFKFDTSILAFTVQ
ncbi:hypothetical protein GW17_00015032 [Ensete ventricosum]|nr:hypothetical protein GW17_00015032 [Ensete ventricosum]RZR79676.1 hypothetical protein BHM03_00005467 [Ensete ventricosum]